MDDLKNKGPQDRSNINMQEDYEVKYWASREIASFECAVCGQTLESWNTAWVPSFRLIAAPVGTPKPSLQAEELVVTCSTASRS
jgi:hypothetical protein